jgi:tRNA-splicing ligase RtcB
VRDGVAAPVVRWLAGKLGDRLTQQIERVTRQPDVVRVAVMPDVHEGLRIPNGVVVATRRFIYPDLVGADIGCGLAALRFAAAANSLSNDDLQQILDLLGGMVPTIKQPAVRANQNRSSLDALGTLSSSGLSREAGRDGRYQLGTLGRGNHFLELARDDAGDMWAVVHTGSRAMGQAITAHHLGQVENTSDSLPFLNLELPEGQAYFNDMTWAGQYAATNRMTILNVLADVLEARHGVEVDDASYIDCPHNIARMEIHGNETLLVHRKSANAAMTGCLGLIAGSMAAGTRVVVGLGNQESLCSSSHGAGRAMSRTEASQRIAKRDLDGMMRGVIYREEWAGRFRDEAPQAYKDFHTVMRAQLSLVRTERTLLPILNDKRA